MIIPLVLGVGLLLALVSRKSKAPNFNNHSPRINNLIRVAIENSKGVKYMITTLEMNGNISFVGNNENLDKMINAAKALTPLSKAMVVLDMSNPYNPVYQWEMPS